MNRPDLKHVSDITTLRSKRDDVGKSSVGRQPIPRAEDDPF